MGRLLFYLRYAWRNLRRSARWTTFAVFCIGAGVATVVALRSLGLAIGDSLVDNVRVSNHGDITLSTAPPANAFFAFFAVGNEDDDSFGSREVERIRDWAEANDATLAFYTRAFNIQITAVDFVSVGRPQFISTLLIDPETFPPYGEILALDPAGVPIGDLLVETNDVLISRNLADQQSLSVGDTVRVSNTDEVFTVRGIVPTEAEAGTFNLAAAFFGFAYLHIDVAPTLQLDPNPNVVSIALPPGTDIEAAERDARNVLGLRGRGISVTTVPEMLRESQMVSDLIGRFIVIMGLGALLIGGVGIINTMLVMVGRRTNEIAALKTFGLKGRQVAALFLTEAFLLGVIGSAVGTVMGIILSVAVNQYGEAFLQQRLTWRLYPEAVLYGLSLGMVVTLVFGVLPILTANRIRPAIILRPNESHIPGVGAFHALIALMLVVVVIGGVAGQIIGSVIIGIIGVALTLLILGILVLILWVIVWLVGKLPSFGVVDVRLALRNLSSRRLRTATTLLALSAGMFALSSITFVGVGTREILQFQLTQNFGGNVLVFPVLSVVSQALGQAMLDTQLNTIDGIEARTRITQVVARVESIDGQEPEVSVPFGDEAPSRMQRAFSSIPLQMRDSTNPNLSSGTIIAGRDLTPEDRGRQVMVVSESFAPAISSPVSVGSQIDVQISGRNYTFEVIGIVTNSGLMGFGPAFIPPDSVRTPSNFQLNILQVPQEKLNQVLLNLSEMPFLLSIDISFIDGLLKRLIDQFAAIPTVVGLLSLLAAAVAMANTVSLATLERRQQIGVLKAVGLKGRRVLWVMLLENTIIGLLGGVLGIGISALGVALMTYFGVGDAIPIPADAMPLAVALIGASVLIAWGATFLSARVAVSERVANVLRYE